MKKLIILTGLLLSTSAYAQTEVTAGVTRGKDYGVTYALPKTAINIEVKVNKVNILRENSASMPTVISG